MSSRTIVFSLLVFAGYFSGIMASPAVPDVSLNSVQGIQSVLSDNGALSNAYLAYTEKYNKEHDPSKLSTFKSNLQKIVDHNSKADAGKQSYTLGVNKFTDMSVQEVIAKYTGYKESTANSVSYVQAGGKPRIPPMIKWTSPPASLDWRTQKVVSPVKDQQNCGSCVLFAATGCHESSHALWHSKEILDLSEQELLDCGDRSKGNNGCSGNTFVPTFDYLVQTGQSLESDYPYTASEMNDGWDANNCSASKFNHPSKLSGWWSVLPHGDENELKKATALYGPVAVAIHVNDAVMGYKSGVLDAPCQGGRNHAVLVVGYGTEGGKDFWLIKNSWGTRWGDNGFFKLRRNNNNMCDVSGDALFVNAA